MPARPSGGRGRQAVAAGPLPALPTDTDVAIDIQRPANPEHGDLATNLALRLAKPLGRAPAAIAGILADAIDTSPGSLSARLRWPGPGFVNLRLADAAIEQPPRGRAGRSLGLGPDRRARLRTPRQRRVRVGQSDRSADRRQRARGVRRRPPEPDPRGRRPAGHARVLLQRLRDAGPEPRGVRPGGPGRRRAIPEDGYHGDYVADLARELPPEIAPAGASGDDAAWAAGRWASERIRTGIEASLERLGVAFDVWTTEGSLEANGWVERAIARLREGGHLYEADGATWFRSTAFGDDKDRVVIRSDGSLTYFAFDVGYVTEKFSRGFDHLIYIWGVDHHGTVARNRNAAEAMGFAREHVEMLLVGWVRFVRDGVEVSMSKRAGNFITLDELLEEIGADAARWFFASRGANVNIDFDIELAKKQSSENPVYYVQYAHARIASILRKADESGLAAAPTLEGALAGKPEGLLARIVGRYPEVVEDAAAAQETQGITAYATELATAFHAFYRDAKVVDPGDPARSAHRLALVDATRITLANALDLLGISAPAAM